MDLIPDRSNYTHGQVVSVEFSSPLDGSADVRVTHLGETVRTIVAATGSTSVSLGSFDRGGYGVTLGAATTAFDVLGSAFERPRYGFVVELTADVDVEAVTRNFRRLHLGLAQLYDWAYRHSQLLPPQRLYVDPLGQERDLEVVNRMSRQLAAAGTAPFGYSAVYAIGSAEVDAWPDSLLLRSNGEPYRLGDDFLVLVDPAEPAWLEHYREQLAAVLEQTDLAGFHLDQYGWPKFAHRSDGSSVDLAASFVSLLESLRDRLPDAKFMFNNVNDFPTYATAASPQDATYIEVWEPHTTLRDLAELASRARSLRPQHPPILSAYLSCFEQDERGANSAAALVMATAWSHGASHLLLGESGNVLTRPYYPDNHRLDASSLDFFTRWYDFQVRYGDLFFDESQVDVTEFFTGGINEDLVFEGIPVSTKAEPGTVWTRVVRTPRGLVVHLINLISQTETVWDAGKNDVVPQSGVTVRIAPVDPGATIWCASPERPDLMPVSGGGLDAAAQLNALSAGQSTVAFALPELREWAIVFIPADELQ